jgi:NAD(P)H-flavin reductase
MSLERMMKCGVGKCGHCAIGDKYCCTDGPVFNYTEIEHIKEAI